MPGPDQHGPDPQGPNQHGPDLNSGGARPATVWLDDAPVDPSWPTPTTAGSPPPHNDANHSSNNDSDGNQSDSRRNRILAVGIPLLAVLLLIGSVTALGGFKDRSDTVTKIALGQTFTNGPLVFTVTKSTIQEAEGWGKYKRIQKVVVTGTVRNTGDEALALSHEWFEARGKRGGVIETAEFASLQAAGQWDGPDHVTPGLPAVPFTVEFDFPPTFKDPQLLVVIGHLTYGTHSYLSSSGNDGYWDTGDGRGFRLQLQPTRLAPEKTY